MTDRDKLLAETIERCAKAVRRLIHCTDDAGEQSLLENAVSDILDLRPVQNVAAAPEAGECSVEPNEISSPASAAAPTTADELHTVICQAVGLHNQGDTTAAAQILRHALMIYTDFPEHAAARDVRLDQRQGAQSANGDSTAVRAEVLPALAAAKQWDTGCQIHAPQWCSCPLPKPEVVRPLVCDGSRQIIEPSPTSNMTDKEFAAVQEGAKTPMPEKMKLSDSASAAAPSWAIDSLGYGWFPIWRVRISGYKPVYCDDEATARAMATSVKLQKQGAAAG